MNRRRGIALARVAGVTLALALVAAAQVPVLGAAGAVSVSISTPTQDQSFSAVPVGLAGSATDLTAGITSASFTAQDRFTGLFLHADGTLGKKQAIPLTVASPGSSQSSWSGTISKSPSTEFQLAVTVTDAIGNTGSAVSRLAVAPTNPTGPAYLTIQWGRTIWSICQSLPNALDLGQIAQDLQSHGLSGTGTVVVNRTAETTRTCLASDSYPSWADLATLRDTYKWRFVSDGMTHNDITKMTLAQQQQESCGSLPYFASHGQNSAKGLFAYGDNHFNTTVQSNVVSTCFSYGRTYLGGRNFRASMSAPWFQRTNSILGGNCATVGAPCYTAMSANVHYSDPQQIANLYNVPGDEWVTVQFYRLVTGQSSHGSARSWDCTSADWRLHWTSQTEYYCLNDFDWALSKLPAGVVVTDPATVALAWGRGM